MFYGKTNWLLTNANICAKIGLREDRRMVRNGALGDARGGAKILVGGADGLVDHCRRFGALA